MVDCVAIGQNQDVCAPVSTPSAKLVAGGVIFTVLRRGINLILKLYFPKH